MNYFKQDDLSHYAQLAEYAKTHHVTMKGPTLFEIAGFGKSGSVLVDLDRRTIKARCDDVTPFNEYDNLIEELDYLEYQWTKYTRN